MLKKLISGKEVERVGKAEIKSTIMYFIVVGIIGLTTFTYFELLINANHRNLPVDLFLCENRGDQNHNINAENTRMVAIVLIPVVAVLFSLNPEVFKKIKQAIEKICTHF